MPPRQQAPAKTGRRIPYFPNTYLHGITKHKAAEYINKVLSPTVARYIILEEPDKNMPITMENSWKFPQGSKQSRVARSLTPLMQSGSSIGNRLGFFDSDTASFLGLKESMHETGEINDSWEHARLCVKYGNIPWYDTELPMNVWCDIGTQHEDLQHLFLLKRYPNAVMHERGLSYFTIQPGHFRDYLSEDENAKITNILFTPAQSPDDVVDLMGEDGKTVEERITAEYKWIAYLLPKNRRVNDDAFQCFDCYEYTFVDRKIYDEPPVYYFLQKQWQMYGEGVKRCHFQYMSPQRDVRYWDVHYDEDIMAMCVTLLNHVFEVFIMKGLSVPCNYFTRQAPTNVKHLHRKMLIAIKSKIIAEVPQHIPAAEVQKTLVDVQRWLKPDQDIRQLEYWYGIPYPRFPACMPLFAVVFVHRVILMGESQDVMTTNIVKKCIETDRRWQNVWKLANAPPLVWLAKVIDVATQNIEVEMAKYKHALPADFRDIKKQFEMKWLLAIERIVERACFYCYNCLHPGEYDPSLMAYHLNATTITPKIMFSVTNSIAETLTRCIDNKSLPQIGEYTSEKTEEVIRNQIKFASADPSDIPHATYIPRATRLVRSCLTVINYAIRQKEEEEEQEEIEEEEEQEKEDEDTNLRIKNLMHVAVSGILIKDGASTICADSSMFGLFKNLIACASVLDTMGMTRVNK